MTAERAAVLATAGFGGPCQKRAHTGRFPDDINIHPNRIAQHPDGNRTIGEKRRVLVIVPILSRNEGGAHLRPQLGVCSQSLLSSTC